MNFIPKFLEENAFSYEGYRAFMQNLIEGKAGELQNQYKDLIDPISRNEKLMTRLENHVTLNPSLTNLVSQNAPNWTWLVIVEPWCGDVGQNLPVMKAISDLSENISLQLILRDQHPGVMKNYTTRGAWSIPVLICLSRENSLTETGSWGPRPEPVQKIMDKHKKEQDPPEKREVIKQIQLWYENDDQRTIQKELESKIQEWAGI